MTGLKWPAVAIASMVAAALCVDRLPGYAPFGAQPDVAKASARMEARDEALRTLLEANELREARAVDGTPETTREEDGLRADEIRDEAAALAPETPLEEGVWRDAAGQRRDDPGLWLALGSFALLSFMVYRWISEDERPPTFDG